MYCKNQSLIFLTDELFFIEITFRVRLLYYF